MTTAEEGLSKDRDKHYRAEGTARAKAQMCTLDWSEGADRAGDALTRQAEPVRGGQATQVAGRMVPEGRGAVTDRKSPGLMNCRQGGHGQT